MDFQSYISALKHGLSFRDRIYCGRRFKRCFRFDAAVAILTKILISDQRAAVLFAQLYEQRLVQRVDPANEQYYQFRETAEEAAGTVSSRQSSGALPHNFLRDEHNASLLNSVRPADWEDPQPAEKYALIAIGGGAAGLISVIEAAQSGRQSALIEFNCMGGDCLVTGCVPSKALLASAKAAHCIRTAGSFGVVVEGGVRVDFSAVMERVRRIRAEIAHHDSAERISNEFAVDVFLGQAQFHSSNQVSVNGQILTFSKCVLATGATPCKPSIPGLDSVTYYTSETIWNLTELPGEMAFLGGGPVACELAQAFSRLGSRVSLITLSESLLPKEDPRAGELLATVFQTEGMTIYTNSSVSEISAESQSQFSLHVSGPYQTIIPCNCLVVAIGRTPNFEGLRLEAAGIRCQNGLVQADQYLQTSNPDVYVAGDCSGKDQFTHAADAMARLAVANALLSGQRKYCDLLIPRVTYTDPEVAHVGETAASLRGKSQVFCTTTKQFASNDRNITEDDRLGFVEILHDGQHILGATVVGTEAGAVLAEVTLAMRHHMTLAQLADVIRPYPTVGEVLKCCAVAGSRAVTSNSS